MDVYLIRHAEAVDAEQVPDMADEDRPLTETQYSLAKTEALDAWIAQQREQADISSDHYNPAEEPTPEQFYPPADAPTPVVATPVPATDVSLTPVAGPQLAPSASPAASPVAGPAGTPAATPAATPAT